LLISYLQIYFFPPVLKIEYKNYFNDPCFFSLEHEPHLQCFLFSYSIKATSGAIFKGATENGGARDKAEIN